MPALRCGNCGQTMQALPLAGAYGRPLELDLCEPCHLVWFDQIEAAHLRGPSLLTLIGQMAAAQTLAHTPLRPDLPCARCAGPVRTVHNPSRWGKSLQLECTQRHGAYQTFGQFLAGKGLVRPMSAADRTQALRRNGALHCVNCGGPVGATDTACPWCASVPSVVDVARLASAVDPEGATRDQPVHHQRGAAGALSCAACGAAQPRDGGRACAACQATLTAAGLAEAARQVSTIGPALQAHGLRPAPHVVRERLALQQPGLDRQRARAAEMQAEADARAGRQAAPADSADVPGLLQDLLSGLWRWLRR